MDNIVLYDIKSPKIYKDWGYKKSVTKRKKLSVNWGIISIEIQIATIILMIKRITWIYF